MKIYLIIGQKHEALQSSDEILGAFSDKKASEKFAKECRETLYPTFNKVIIKCQELLQPQN